MLLLRISAFLCLAGWAWVHLYWEAPYGILLWQDGTYGLAERFGISWDDFVGSGANDGLIQTWMFRAGWLYVLGAVLAITVRRKAWVQMGGLVGAAMLLFVLAYARYVGAERQLPMLVEHGGQILSPVLLVLALALGPSHRLTILVAMLSLVTAFAGHGCYAVGLWPTPATFPAMISVILGVGHETAGSILVVAGILDFVICIGIFIPALRGPSVLYAVGWGLLTALARPVAGMSLDLNLWGADQFLHEAALRAPHFVAPLYLFLHWRQGKKFETLASGPQTEAESGQEVSPAFSDGGMPPEKTSSIK